jgi:hypothetical protein
MTIALLSDLREPPVVGRFYMVPTVPNYPWYGRRADWPVLGPLHEDAEFFNFPTPHFHVDLRFLSTHQIKFAARCLPGRYASGDTEEDAALTASAAPLNTNGEPVPKRATLKRMKCRRASYSTTIDLYLSEVRPKMEARYGSPAPAIRRADGRLLCPHRKADLSQFLPDADGIVTCPLHGLRVLCVPSPHPGTKSGEQSA